MIKCTVCIVHLNKQHFVHAVYRREIFFLTFSLTKHLKNVKVDPCRQRHRGHQGGRDCKTYLMRLADSQKEDITINRTAKWELSPQTYKLSCDSSCGLTSAWEIKYPGSRCSYNQWCYFLYFKLPLAAGAAFKNKVCHLSSLQFGPDLD